jgi:hypothetical protein
MNKKYLHQFNILFFGTLAFGLLGFILISNYTPLGVTKTYVYSKDKEISALGPKERVFVDGLIQKQTSDLIYFTTEMPYRFESAKVRITFQNPNLNQDLYLGFRDKGQWHYETKLIDTPVLDGLDWQKVGNEPTLFQRQPQYRSVQEFFRNAPEDKIIGVYNFDSNILPVNSIPDYTSSNKETVIDTALRGKQIFYVFVKDEPFKISISKQDLNWYEGEDVATVKIYKDKLMVYSAIIDDDGIIDSSKKVITTQEAIIQNPGPGLPENGIYKVVIDSTDDSIVKKISTNLKNIVFEGPLFLIGNSESSQVIDKAASTMFTDALVITAKTIHDSGLQEIKIGDKILKLENRNQEVATDSAGVLTEVYVPKNDVIINGLLGYFAFSKDSFFRPSAYKIIPLTKKEDLEVVDFVLATYNQPITSGEWKISEMTFDLSSAEFKNGKLSWLIKAPGLKEKGSEIRIKNIEVEFTKKPLIKFQ